MPYYVHDYFGPGRHAKIVSTKAKDLLADGNEYRKLPPLTGDESVVAEVSDVAWPQLLHPVDDLPPATIITSVRRDGGKLLVRGVSHDNGEIIAVTVNDHAGPRHHAALRCRRLGSLARSLNRRRPDRLRQGRRRQHRADGTPSRRACSGADPKRAAEQGK